MPPDLPAVLIAAGDPELRQQIHHSIQATGFPLAEAPDTQAALKMLRTRSYDVVLLDRNLPEGGGEEACRQLRALSPELGIIAVRVGGTAEDEFRMIEAGADDCIAMPFRFREIVARMGVLRGRTPPPPAVNADLIRAGKLEVDLRRRIVRRDGRETHLTPGEFDLLAVLMTNAGVALTHQKLVWATWGGTASHNRAYLRSYIKSLRQKIEDDPANPSYIMTQPWVGYRFSGH